MFLYRFMQFMKHNRGTMDLQRWMTIFQLTGDRLGSLTRLGDYQSRTFDFVEICGGAGKVSDAVRNLGHSAAPVLDLSLTENTMTRLACDSWNGLCTCWQKTASAVSSLRFPAPASARLQILPSAATNSHLDLTGSTQKLSVETCWPFEPFFSCGLGSDAGGLADLSGADCVRRAGLSCGLACVPKAFSKESLPLAFLGPSIERSFVSCATCLMWISLTDAAQVDMPMYESKAPTRKLLQCMVMDLPRTWVWLSTKPYGLLMLLRVWLQMCLALSPLANDIMLASRWSTVRAWFWKRTAHINVLELASAVSNLGSVAKKHASVRFVNFLDSAVCRGALAKQLREDQPPSCCNLD